MLKSIDTAKSFEQLVEKKCAEVFFRKENCFSIICTHCELKTFNFEDYLLHFKNVHLSFWNSRKYESNIQNVKIKTENDDMYKESTNVTGDQWHQFGLGPLAELQEVPLSDSVDSQGNNLHTYEEQSTIWGEENDFGHEEEPTDSPDEEQSDQDSEFMPRILKLAQAKNKINTEFKCKECNNYYKFAKNLERHVKKCHEDDDAGFQCVRCKQHFNDERSLNAHQRKRHSGFPCGKCDKVYTTKEALNIHEYKHTGVRSFHCNKDGCGKSFFNPKQLSMHTRIVHQLEKNFVCEICGFRTKGRSALIVHKRSHTGEKPFICKLCDKGFASKSLLCEHEPIHSTERPHICDVCGRAFSRPKALYHHKHLHLGIKKFVCKLCGRAYAQMAGLAGHMRQHRTEQC